MSVAVWRIRAGRARPDDIQKALPGAIAEHNYSAAVWLMDQGANPVHRGGEPISRAVKAVAEQVALRRSGDEYFGTYASYTLAVLIDRATKPPYSLTTREVWALPALKLNLRRFIPPQRTPRYRDRDGFLLDPQTCRRVHQAKERQKIVQIGGLLSQLFG